MNVPRHSNHEYLVEWKSKKTGMERSFRVTTTDSISAMLLCKIQNGRKKKQRDDVEVIKVCRLS